MKKWIYASLVLSLLFSCSKIDDTTGETEKEIAEKSNSGHKPDGKGGPKVDKNSGLPVKFKLEASDVEKNIFEMAAFRVSVEGNDLPFMYVFYLSESYDSIVWKVSGEDKGLKIFSHTSNSSDFSFRWSHHFFFPGEYQTYLLGYKENKVIYSDTTGIKITDKKEFLGYDWAEVDGSVRHSVGYHNSLSENRFTTFQSVNNNRPGVTFSLWNNPPDGDKILSDCISRLYSSPLYGRKEEELLAKKYRALFNYTKEEATPLSIWITPASKIVLLKNGPEYGHREYEIYAEPNR